MNPPTIKYPIVLTLALLLLSTIANANNSEAEYDTIALAKLENCSKFYHEGAWINALISLHKFITEYESNRDIQNTAYCARAYLLLGNLHVGFTDYANAEKYYLHCLKLAKAASNDNLATTAYVNLALTCCHLRKKEKAYEYLSLNRAMTPHDTISKRINNDIIEAYLERHFGDWKKSINQQKRVVSSIYSSGANRKKLSTPLSEITEMYEENNQIDSAVKYLKLYEKIACEYNIVDMMTLCLRIKMRIFTKTGMKDSALFYQDRYFNVKDSLLNTRNFLQIAADFNNSREQASERNIDNLKSTVGRQSLTLTLAGLLLLISVAATVIIFIQFRKVKSNYIVLYEKDRELEALEQQTALQKHKDEHIQRNQGQQKGVVPSEFLQLKEKILDIMQNTQEWLNPEFSLQRLAELTDSNTKYISTVINECFSINFRSFINEYRIREAKAMMTDQANFGSMTIHAIGEHVGFKSSTSFISAFKKHTGLTPSFYLKMSIAENRKKNAD